MSLLDNDFYKFSLLQVIFEHFNDVQVKYKLFDRRNKVLPIWNQIKGNIQEKYNQYLDVRFTHDELLYLEELGFSWEFVDCLEWDLQLDTIEVDWSDGIEYSGSWLDATLWEIKFLQFINEVYCKALDSRKLIDRVDSLGSNWAEFGTRRRQSKLAQEIAIQRYKHNGGQFTSNVEFAMKYGLTPVGTYPHELPMALSVLYGEEEAQYEALKVMKKVFPDRPLYALTDTYTTDLFLSRFWEFENLTIGARHDSACPLAWADKMIQWYKDHGKNPKDKILLFTDGLDNEKKNNIEKYVGDRAQVKFGVGTWATNPSEDTPDTVIKLVEVSGKSVCKISDDLSKSIGVK